MLSSNNAASPPVGLGHSVDVDSRTGAAALRIPVPLSPGRGGFGPAVSLTYASGGGNSVVGAGWSLNGCPSVELDVQHEAPRYDGRDAYAIGGERLVRELDAGTGAPRVAELGAHRVTFYRARSGYGALRVERWADLATGAVHWRTRDRSDVVTVYGRAATARIADPADSSRVFRWLAESRHDPTGNALLFEYAAEDGEGVDPALSFEAARLRDGRFAQRYPKRLRYSNAAPLGPDDVAPADLIWHVEVVFDYGDHDLDDPQPIPDRARPVRADAFSVHRPGFEVRTYRLLRRVLVFHRADALGPAPVCVGVTRLTHAEHPAGSTLTAVDYEGRRSDDGIPSTRALPPLTLTYAAPQPADTFEALPPDAVDNVPAGLAGGYRWVDLHGEGLPGILTEAGGAWWYKPNLGGGGFGPQERVAEAPSFRDGPYALADFDRDGNPDLGRMTGQGAGYFAYDRDARAWSGFQPFVSAPHVPEGTRMEWVDLNADGLPDLVVPHPDHFVWYPSLGREGFGKPVTVPLPEVPGGGPPLVTQDVALGFFFADMSGDGLPDLVHIDNGRVAYWPHLGHGRFGARVEMEDAPTFDHDGTYDPRRLRLTDLDGSGTTDIIYLGRGEVRFWTNAAGNRWVDPQRRVVPYIDDLASVQVLDLLADGTACLVWSSTLPGDAASPIRYLPLTQGVQPRLLLEVDNGLGRTVRLTYGRSAGHYLHDEAAGRPWLSRLPSHVTVVETKEEQDLIGGAHRVTRYAYHDGHFDGDQRRFRGFGQVDQYDAEDFPGPGARPVTHMTPTCIRTWFHDGAPGRHRLRADAYWAGDPSAATLPPPRLASPADVDAAGYADAYRALAGLTLRQEVYATDDGVPAPHPLQVVQNTYEVRRLQPARDDDGAVFAAVRTERIDADYDGQPDDPRVAHHLTLDVDAYGLIRTEAHVAYPRRQASPAGAEAQQTLHASAARTTLVHVDTPARYRIGVDVEAEEFALFGLDAAPSGRVDREALAAALSGALATALAVHDDPPGGPGLAARRQTWERTFFWNDARTDVLPLGQVGAPALVHHEATACFTGPLIQDVFGGRVTDAMLRDDGGYVEADGHWWQPGSTHVPSDRDRFYSVVEEIAPDGGRTRLTFDAATLFHTRVEDALGNVTQVEIDYQSLGPQRIVDPNGTVAETRYDPLGAVLLTSRHGAARDAGGTAQPYGSDALAAYASTAAPTLAAVLADPAAFLQRADHYAFYDLDAWQRDGTPPVAVTLSREALVHDGEGGVEPAGPIQVALGYLDGFGRVLQQKQRVEAGPAIQRDAGGAVVLGADGTPVLADAAERWRVSGHRVYGNKQQLVRQYEPFFSATPAFEPDEALQRYGVAAEHQYDALGRLVRTDFPGGTFTRTDRTPWLERTFDANDTVAASAYRLAREILPAGDPERIALDGALAHADTPTTTHVDARGLEILMEEQGAGGTVRTTQQRYDADGHLAEVVDARGLSAFRYRHDMLGRGLYVASVDAGERWTLPDRGGDPVHVWDARGVHFATTYDALGRPTRLRADGALGLDQVIERWTYGESLPAAEAEARNARGRLVEHHDEAGVLVVDAYSIEGLPLRQSRRLRTGYGAEPDWDDPAAVALEPETFETQTRYDALSRVTEQTTPDGATRHLRYHPSGSPAQIRLTTAGGALVDVPLLSEATYNARGQRTQAVLGNDVRLDVEYDPDTFRMRRLQAQRTADGATRVYQDIAYTYDPAGNVLRLSDAAQQPSAPDPRVVQGLSVSADALFTYDPFYQLTQATGRVHQALLEHDYRDGLPHPDAAKGTRHITLNNGAAVERYTRTYQYDDAGNLRQVRHVGATRNWTTDYWVSPTSNRRLQATDPNGLPVADPEGSFDAAGHCIRQPHLRGLAWTSRGHLARAVLIDRSADGGPDDAAYYVYDGGGQRRRKVTERLVDGQLEVTEKLYLDGCEIKRIRQGTTLILERHTALLTDGVNRLALVHHWVRDDRGRESDAVGSAPGATRIHYPLQNHLGSTALELNESGEIVTYEEFFPYGGSAFIAGDQLRDVRLKDYRYSGKERDDETGFDYYGYRYYAAFIGGWLSPDPTGPADGLNLYRFVRNNPVTLTDPNGLQSGDVVQLATVSADATEAQAIAQANWSFAYARGFRITDLTPHGERDWLISGHRPLTQAERDRYSRIQGYLGSESEEMRQLGELLRTLEEVTEPLQEPFPEGFGGGGGSDDAGEPGGGTVTGDPPDDTQPGDSNAPTDATGTPGDGDAGPSPDPADPSADAVHDANGDSTSASGAGPREGAGRDREGTGLGVEGTGPGGGGDAATGTGTGTEGTGTGGGSGGAGRGRSSGGTGGAGEAAGTPGAAGTGLPGAGGNGTGLPGTGTSGDGTATGGADGSGEHGTAADGTAADGTPTGDGAEGVPPAQGGEAPPNGYRPPPPGTQPGGDGANGRPEGGAGDPNGASGQGGAPGSGQGGNGQGERGGAGGGDAPGGPPRTRERDALDTLVDVASYVTLDAFFGGDEEGGGDENGIPGGLGLFDLNLGRWGQVAYVGLAAVDLVLTIVSLGETKAMMVGAKQALRQGLRQVRRLAPLAKQALRQTGEAAANFIAQQSKRALNTVRGLANRSARQPGVRRKFSEWLNFFKDQGGVTQITGRLNSSKWWPRFQTTVQNFETPGTWAFRDTAAHEGFHALLARHAGIIWKAGDARIGPVPIGAPVKYLEEVAAYAIGHSAALRFHGVPLAPLEAFGSLSARESFTVLGMMGVGAGAYFGLRSDTSSTSAPTDTSP